MATHDADTELGAQDTEGLELAETLGLAKGFELAQPLELADQHGQTVSIPNADAPQVVVFFPYAFTPTCTRELAEIQEHLDDFAAAGVSVVGISTDSRFTLRYCSETFGLELPLLSDHWPHGAAARAFGVLDERTGVAKRVSFLLDSSGRVLDSCASNFGNARPWEWYRNALKRSAA